MGKSKSSNSTINANIANTLIGIVDSAKECRSISESATVDIKKLEVQSNILIKKIEKDKEVFLKILEYTFQERNDVIRQSFDCIDKAIETNNVELMNQAFAMVHHILKRIYLVQIQ